MRHPSRNPLSQMVPIFVKPPFEINPIEQRGSRSKSCNSAQDRKEVVGLVGIDLPNAVLMVTLQQKRADMPLRNILVVQSQSGIDYVATDHAFGLNEIMLIMTVGAAERDNSCYGV